MQMNPKLFQNEKFHEFFIQFIFKIDKKYYMIL